MKRGIECGGYSANRIFISYDQKTMQVQNVGRSRTATPKSLDDINSVPEIQEQLFATFMGAYFPACMNGDTHVDSWRYLISSFQVLPHKTMMLQRALSAICCVYIGRINDDERLSHHGIQLYNSSMLSMSKMLCTKTHSEESLYATVIFQMIEKCIAVKNSTGPSGVHGCANGFDPWVFHMQAMSSLLKENQHKLSTSPLINDVSSSHAKLAITPLDDLFDIFVTGRSLLDAIEAMNTLPLDDPKISPNACFASLKTIVEYRERITSWYAEKEAQIGGPPMVCEVKDTKLFNNMLLENNPFGSIYRFASLDNARIHILYWTAMNFAHTLVYRAQMMVVSANHAIFPADDFPTDPSNYESFVKASHYIDQVCRAIPYCMQPMHRIWGTHIVFGTIGNVFRTYIQRQSREKFLWCQRVLEAAGALGLGMAFYFSGVANREWVAMEEITESMVRTPEYAASPDDQYPLDDLIDSSSPLSSDYFLQPVDLQVDFQLVEIPALSFGEVCLEL
ncbi:hypothetical protein N7481_006105 [Penicillium waksmanii]|uniref:uncharacterized protein n=1 Tax=Penicillium waksmanii TaxID=69791 RepID=UPI002546995A|nr:uncharacterized protein N7481_006105 [Penicillium waksmanii]KAJ5984006.1 hypothetical protein N7481_006105 [Penicillium waksmanii]